MQKRLSYEYIRGLIDGEGCFTFYPVTRRIAGQSIVIKRYPTFVIGMSQRDDALIENLKYTLGIRNKIYRYKAVSRKDGYKRQGTTRLVVRDVGQLKNIIVPLFYKKLNAYKAKQFEDWLEKIGSDPLVPEEYKFIHKLYKWGYFDRNPKFI